MAGVETHRHVRELLDEAPKTKDLNQIVNISKLIAKQMTPTPKLEKELNPLDHGKHPDQHQLSASLDP